MPIELRTASLATPLGDLDLAIDPAGALVALAFRDCQDLAALAGPDAVLSPNPAFAAAALAQLREYFAGARRTFDLPLAPRIGTAFQRRVWSALVRIQPGTTWSYARLAAETGSVARAVGAANAANPIALVVPCHRVIGADGSLTGYAGGLERKRWLLTHEGALLG
jgi:methylated-DNA-[protein]-cysteine S-methyltransferase